MSKQRDKRVEEAVEKVREIYKDVNTEIHGQEQEIEKVKALLTNLLNTQTSRIRDSLLEAKELLGKRICPLDQSSENPDEDVCSCPTCEEFNEGVIIIDNALEAITPTGKGGE